jgi:hypothetical protein
MQVQKYVCENKKAAVWETERERETEKERKQRHEKERKRKLGNKERNQVSEEQRDEAWKKEGRKERTRPRNLCKTYIQVKNTINQSISIHQNNTNFPTFWKRDKVNRGQNCTILRVVQSLHALTPRQQKLPCAGHSLERSIIEWKRQGIHIKFWSETLKGRNRFVDLGVRGRVILKRMLKEQGVR